MEKELLESIQKQINFEFYSSYLYLAMSSYCESEGWKGFSNWLRVQAKEELFHATYMHDYLLRRGEQSKMLAIDEPADKWDSLQVVFNTILQHEKIVTKNINAIASMALDSKDHALYQFIMQYVEEQVEEEENATELLNKINRAESSMPLLYALDNELAQRVYSQPFGVAE